MIVTYVDETKPSAPFTEEGTKVTFTYDGTNLTVDLNDLQEDFGTTKNITVKDGKIYGPEQIQNGLTNLAVFDLPPAQYEMVDTGEVETMHMNGEEIKIPKQDRVRKPIDMKNVKILVFPLEG